MGGTTDVHGGEDREDVSLQERDENLERGEEHQHEERQNADRNQGNVAALNQFLREKGKGHEKDVTGEHVGKQTNCQRERTHEERRDELDRRHKNVERPRYPRREERVLEISEALMLETNADEDNPDEQ